MQYKQSIACSCSWAHCAALQTCQAYFACTQPAVGRGPGKPRQKQGWTHRPAASSVQPHARGASGPRLTAPARAAGGRGGMWSSRGRRPSRSSPWGRARAPPARPRPPTRAAPAAAAHNPHSAGGQPRKACPPLQLRRHLQQLEKASRQRCAWLPAAGLPGSRARAGHAALRTALDHAASQSACASLSQTSAQAGRRHRRHAAAACPRSLHQPQLHHAALDSCA